jgi:hypothetical protein
MDPRENPEKNPDSTIHVIFDVLFNKRAGNVLFK